MPSEALAQSGSPGTPTDHRRTPLVYSRFTHRVRGDSWDALFHALQLEIIFAAPHLLDELPVYLEDPTATSPDARPELKRLVAEAARSGILIDAEDPEAVDDALLARVTDQVLPGPRLAILYLALTDTCNLNCTYCMVEPHSQSRAKHGMMTRATVDRALEFFCRHYTRGDPARTVILYGGEPLVNRTVLRYAVEQFREAQRQQRLSGDLEIAMVTNGTLLTRDLALFFKRHSVQIGVSIDGPPQVHDICRRTVGGRGSFDAAIRGFRLLREVGCNPALSVTVGNHNVDQMEAIARWIIEELNVKQFGFNMLLDNSRMQPENGYADRFSAGVIRTFEFCRGCGAYENRMMRKVEALVKQRVHADDCGAIGYQAVVAPDGTVGVCQGFLDDRYSYIPLDRLDTIRDHPVISEFARRSPLTMSECQGCIALGTCGGGCPCRAHYVHGSIWDMDESFCVHSKSAVEWLIRRMCDESAPNLMT